MIVLMLVANCEPASGTIDLTLRSECVKVSDKAREPPFRAKVSSELGRTNPAHLSSYAKSTYLSSLLGGKPPNKNGVTGQQLRFCCGATQLASASASVNGEVITVCDESRWRWGGFGLARSFRAKKCDDGLVDDISQLNGSSLYPFPSRDREEFSPHPPAPIVLGVCCHSNSLFLGDSRASESIQEIGLGNDIFFSSYVLGVVAGLCVDQCLRHLSCDGVLGGRLVWVVIGFVHPCFGHGAISYVRTRNKGGAYLYCTYTY
eukprot:scaffold23990_cov47-Cyclotella_meneghiniana.AAC.6